MNITKDYAMALHLALIFPRHEKKTTESVGIFQILTSSWVRGHWLFSLKTKADSKIYYLMKTLKNVYINKPVPFTKKFGFALPLPRFKPGLMPFLL